VTRQATLDTLIVVAPELPFQDTARIVGEGHLGIGTTPHVLDAVFLHIVLGHVVLVMRARDGPGLYETNWWVELGPGRARPTLVLFETLDDIGGFADVVFALDELKSVERLHGDRKDTYM
jgi:hypothetical protein